MDIEPLMNEGVAALRQGKAEWALDCFTQAQAAQPGNFMALGYRGTALLKLERFQAALECFEQAAVLAPDNGEVRRNLGVALNGLQRHAEALLQFDRALALNPGDLNARNSRGAALHGLGRDTEALVDFDGVLAVNPDHVNALFNRAVALWALGRHEEELACLDRVVTINPGHVMAAFNRGSVLLRLGRGEQAAASIERACALAPDKPLLRLSLATTRLLLGDFAAGFRDYENRWERRDLKEARLVTDRPLWLGQAALEGKTILLHGEQGLGDVLQFVRYAPLVAARGARVILLVPPVLVELCRSLPGIAQLIADRNALPAYDMHCPLMSLPLAFGTRLETIPADIPYLRADPSRVARWKEKLGPALRPRIGLVWAGNQAFEQTRRRDAPLQRLLPLLQLPAAFISLQKEVSERDRAVYQQAQNLVRYGESLTDFADTAALVENLDLVMSVDTSVVHLAGALGKPVWLLNRHYTCWRWLLDRSDSPWYPSLRIFRPRGDDDWESVVEKAGREFSSLMAGKL